MKVEWGKLVILADKSQYLKNGVTIGPATTSSPSDVVCGVPLLGTWSWTDPFYPRDAMLARVFATATCLSVRPSVRPDVCHTPVLCLAERKQDREMYTF